MIVSYNDKTIFSLAQPFIVQHTTELQKEIDLTWEKFSNGKDPKDFFNGNVFLITDIKNDNGYILTIGQSKYADLIFAKRTSKITVRSLFVASYVITFDKQICVIKNKRNKINTIGGMADKADFIGQQFIPLNCLLREWKEEIGIDLNDFKNYFSVTPRYLKIPSVNEMEIPLYPIGILYEVKTNLTSLEIISMFNKYKSLTDGEVSELVFYNKDTFSQVRDCKNAESYLFELFENIINSQS